MKRFAILLLCIFLLVALISVGSLFAQEPMPNYVLHAAQNLNALYGANIDINNVIWSYVDYNLDLAGASAACPQVAQAAPVLNNTRVYLVEFQPVRGGVWGEEIWEAIVYGDLSFVGLCSAPLAAVTPLAGTGFPTVTPSNCGTLPSRLVIGQEARVAGDSPNNLRTQPFVSGQYVGEIPPQAIFLVLDGPRCSADGAWWYVNFNGTVGWTLEGQSGEYYLEPLSIISAQATAAPTVAPFSPLPAPIVCNPAMPSRLLVGQEARVTPGIPNNIRAQAGSSGQLLGEIPAGGILRVLAGPTCASGVAWFQVDYNGLVGWTGEGMDGDYWLEPAYVIFAPLRLENLAASQQVSSFALSNADALQFNNANMLFARNANNISFHTAFDPFAPLNTLSWVAQPIMSSTTTILAMHAIGNDVEWIASMAANESTDLRISQRVAFGVYEERHLISERNISKAVFSPHATYLMLLDNNQDIQVFDLTVGQVVAVLPTGGSAVRQMTFSPDGRVFAAGYTDGFVVWQVSNWAVLGSAFFDSPSTFQALTLNNRHFAFALATGQEAIAFVVPIENIAFWPQSGSIGHTEGALSLALAPDSSFLLIATRQGLEMAGVPRVAPFATRLNLAINGTVRLITISPDGRFLAIATENNVALWGTANP